MKKITVDLENCYGIKKLKHEFDFSKKSAFAIYAPNGIMKSSLAQTFKDIADGAQSGDRIFPSRKSQRKITDEFGKPLPKAAVLVVRSVEEAFGTSEETSTLLVDAALRKQYEQLHADINRVKETFFKALKTQSGSKKDLEAEISATFTASENEFIQALIRIESEVESQTEAPLATIPYDVINDEKVLAFLDNPVSREAIAEYIKRYNELIAASVFFKQGVFDYYDAATIAKNLADHGFFEAKHSVRLNAAKTAKEITSQKELEELIATEKESITKDKELRRKFDQIDKLITKNVQLRDFRDYIEQHEDLLPRLANMKKLREDLWKSYFKAQDQLFRDLVSKIKSAAKRKAEIEAEANKQRTRWEEAIDIFNYRFFVPFKLVANNRIPAILGQEILSLGFIFQDQDSDDRASIGQNELMKVLSAGERKAFHLLHVIFEIEVRRKAGQATVIVIDDIADSFDYKNKYAIVQYLKDNSEERLFNQIILTHNFDFFRTINSRFVSYSQCLMAFRDKGGIALKQATGIKNVFVNDWQKNFFTEPRKKIACIPFIRNIIEYTKGDQDPDYTMLTSLLHWKPETANIQEKDLNSIFSKTFPTVKGTAKDGSRPVLELVKQEAKECLSATQSMNFENKVVLSMAIRMVAEKYMIDRIDDPAFVKAIEAQQTSTLFERFRRDFQDEPGTVTTLERVVLMTPENIHLNSFMYEPILDMSDDHLRKLYQDMLKLSGESP
jgi:hypothetical protein